MKTQEIIYRLSLNAIKGIGPVRSKKIIDTLQDTSLVFSSGKKFLKQELGLTEALALEINQYHQFDIWEKELETLSKEKVHLLFHDQADYPVLLKQCGDNPPILYAKGELKNLNKPCIAIIGTRHCSDYGKKLTEDLVSGLASYGIAVISGLAFGIDGFAHREAIRNQLPTFGVLAHGLSDVYPPAHKSLSIDMQADGGLLTEYSFFSRASRENFPARNRIVAGMSAATIIIETDIRGGSMITADMAYSYNRDVFCFPGRVQDRRSAGCNYLIKQMKAQLITSANDVVEALGWKKKPLKQVQRSMFLAFNEDEHKVIEPLQEVDALHYDELCARSGLHTSSLSHVLLQLELQGVLQIKPGKMVQLIR